MRVRRRTSRDFKTEREVLNACYDMSIPQVIRNIACNHEYSLDADDVESSNKRPREKKGNEFKSALKRPTRLNYNPRTA